MLLFICDVFVLFMILLKLRKYCVIICLCFKFFLDKSILMRWGGIRMVEKTVA